MTSLIRSYGFHEVPRLGAGLGGVSALSALAA